MNTLQAVARILKLERVEWVSCFPSNNLIEAVAAEGIRPLLFRQERGALMAADGFSRLNDRQKFGVVITQGGPGAENSMGGIAQAFADNVPMLVFQGGPSTREHAVRPNFSPARTYQSVTRHTEIIWKPDMVADVLRRAFHILRNGRPGPVVVEIPSDVDGQEVPEAALAYQSPVRSPQAPSSGAVKDAVQALLGARKPVIWSGMGTLFSQATDELRELAELTQIPVYRTMPGKSGFDERHPWRSVPAAARRPSPPSAGSRSRTSSSRSAPASRAPPTASRFPTARPSSTTPRASKTSTKTIRWPSACRAMPAWRCA
ncbi:MAG: thiamine pyrophosphate-binding protein [Thermomicrobiales bacterium]